MRSSARWRWRWWAIRACGIFLVVYVLGALGAPTLIPYIAALIVILSDAVRTAAPRN